MNCTLIYSQTTASTFSVCISFLSRSYVKAPCSSQQRDNPNREGVASKLEGQKRHQLEELWLEVLLSVVWERPTVWFTPSSSTPTLPSLPLLLLIPPSSCCGKAARLQPLWASSQPAITAPIHNRRIVGSPKLKALLSLRLVATVQRSDRFISLCRLGWPWLWPLVCTPSRHTIQTWSCQQGCKHKAESQRQAGCYWISHSTCGEWEFPNLTLLTFFPIVFEPKKCPCEWISI